LRRDASGQHSSPLAALGGKELASRLALAAGFLLLQLILGCNGGAPMGAHRTLCALPELQDEHDLRSLL
jgi:hypothetical protein